MQAKEAMLKKKKQDLEYIKAKVDDKEILQPDTIISRELLQNKMDIGIFQKLK